MFENIGAVDLLGAVAVRDFGQDVGDFGAGRIDAVTAMDAVICRAQAVQAAQMVAAFNALDEVATAQRACGDTRTRGQIMVDVFVECITGTVKAPGVGVEIGLVMGAGTLLGDDRKPANLMGYRPISAEIALAIIAEHEQTWIRRLFTGKTKKLVINPDLHGPPTRMRIQNPPH